MSYVKHKADSETAEATVEACDHSWAEERVPLLQSGFMEPTALDANRSIIALQLYVSNGTYRARVQDRQDSVQAFVNGTNLETIFDAVEAGIRERTLDWKPMNNGKLRPSGF